MGLLNRLLRRPSSTWSAQAESVIQLNAHAWGLLNMTWSAMCTLATKRPLTFQIYADYNYGALIAMMYRCVGSIPGEEGRRAAQYFVQGFKNDLHTQNTVFAEAWLSKAYVEPDLDAPRLNEVAYIGHGVMHGLLRGRGEQADLDALFRLTADAEDSAKFSKTLSELLATHQARLRS